MFLAVVCVVVGDGLSVQAQGKTERGALKKIQKMEDTRSNLIHEESSPKTPDLLAGKSIHVTNGPPQTYLPSDSDSDVDENGTPPTIIKRKSEVPRSV